MPGMRCGPAASERWMAGRHPGPGAGEGPVLDMLLRGMDVGVQGARGSPAGAGLVSCPLIGTTRVQ